jgi:hypothetical protein
MALRTLGADPMWSRPGGVYCVALQNLPLHNLCSEALKMTPLKILAALFIVAALITLFIVDNIKVFAVLLILGNLLGIFDHFGKRSD